MTVWQGIQRLSLKNAKVAHIDIDPAEIGKIIAVDIPVVGDAKKALQQLLAEPTVHNNTENGLKGDPR